MKTVSIPCLGLNRKGQEFGRKGRPILPILWVEKISSDVSRFTRGGKDYERSPDVVSLRVQFHNAAELLRL